MTMRHSVIIDFALALGTIALEFFALSWLAKGRARWTAKQLAHRARRPVAYVKHAVRQARRPVKNR